jgi:2-polyprenyl-6-hydroxyphenyl methylase/3-demethylubiquinone-9 3-methyltransferase
MPLGPFIRRMFGPYERQISDVYRSIYIDIDAFVGKMREWQPSAQRILEVGCGEGSITERLSLAYPAADINAIDITPRLGRLYRGARDNVRFRKCTIQEVAASEPWHYDFVVLSDVMHHVTVEHRQSMLDAVRTTLTPGGTFVFKDWERNNTPIHWMCYASDRWLTGDRIVYMQREEMRRRLAHSFGDAALVAEARLSPWHNNLAMLVRL